MNFSQLSSLNFLQKTQNVTFYQSKRKRSRYDSSDCSTNRKSQQNQRGCVKGKSSFAKNWEKSNRNQSGDVSFREMKRKLKEVLDGSIQEGIQNDVSRRISLTQCSNKKTESFRITPFRTGLKKKVIGKGEEVLQNTFLEPIHNEFKVKQALIQRRQSLNDPKTYERLGFKRHFLKQHGETKCFEKAVQFKKIKYQDKPFRFQNSMMESGREVTLNYSSDDLQGDVQGWKKIGKQMQWSQFSHLQP